MKSFLQQSVIYGLGQVAIQLVGFLIYPILTNDQYFTVAQFGIWNILAPLMTILTIIYSGGLSTGFFKFFINNESSQQRYSAFINSVHIVILGGAFVTLVVLPILIFTVSPMIQPGFQWEYFIPVMLTAFANSVIGICLAVYRAQNHAKQFIIINSARFILMSGLIILGIIVLKRGLWGLLLAYAISSVVVSIFLFVKTYSSFEKTQVLIGQRTRILKYSAPLIPTQLAGWVLSVSDKFVIGILLGATQVGLYSAGYQIALVTNAFFIAPFSLAWGPFMFKEGVQKDGPVKIARLFEIYTVLGAVFVTPLILFGVDLIGILSNNNSYAESYRVIAPVALGYLFFGYYLFYTTGYNLTDRTKYFPLITGLVGILNILLNVLLLPQWGYLAAAWVTLVSYFLLFLIMKLATSRIYALPVKWIKIWVIWILMVCVVWYGSYLIQKFNVGWPIFVKGSLVCLVWAMVIIVGGVSSTDISSVFQKKTTDVE